MQGDGQPSPCRCVFRSVVLDFALLIMQIVNGLQLGLLLFLVASGLTLVFGILDFVNLAHASMYTVGALICASLTFVLGSFLWAVLAALPIAALVGWLIERLVARKLYGRDHLDQVLATFGLILVMITTAQLIWGPQGIAVPLPQWLKGQVTWGDTAMAMRIRQQHGPKIQCSLFVLNPIGRIPPPGIRRQRSS